MRPHEPEDVARLKDSDEIRRGGRSEQFFEMSGLAVFYTTMHTPDKKYDFSVESTILPQDYKAEISRDDYEIAVSDDVPIDLRELWAWHELHTLAVVGHYKTDRYLTGEKKILNNLTVMSERYKQYLKIRIPYYEGLLNFIHSDRILNGENSAYDDSDIEEINKTIEFLETIEKATLPK